MNVAAAVILYHPDSDLVKRIQSYLPHINRLFVLDNTEGTAGNLSAYVIQSPKVVYFADGENKGISARLNQAARLAIEEGFEWLLTMDQDSYFSENMIISYLNCIFQYQEKNKAAMFGTQYSIEETEYKGCVFKKVDHLITSGSILNLSLFDTIGPFDEALFIDKVDQEYCMRAISKGLDIVRFENIFLHHSLGKIVYGRSLKNFKKTPRTIHSPQRMYYIVRNYFYLRVKYKGRFESSFSEMKKELYNRTKNNFLYGRQRWTLIKFLIKGYTDFRKKRFGKLNA